MAIALLLLAGLTGVCCIVLLWLLLLQTDIDDNPPDPSRPLSAPQLPPRSKVIATAVSRASAVSAQQHNGRAGGGLACHNVTAEQRGRCLQVLPSQQLTHFVPVVLCCVCCLPMP
jgi:hypothetical protein